MSMARMRIICAPLLGRTSQWKSTGLGIPRTVPGVLFSTKSEAKKGSTDPPPPDHSHTFLDHNHSHSEHSHSHAHGGHTHSHTHSLTGESSSTGNLRNPAVKITFIGFSTNVGMAGGKFVGGVVFNSQSSIADSIHASSDLVSDVSTLATVSVARRPPTPSFPHGYGRIEAMGAFGVSSLLLTAGISMGFGSLSEVSHAFGSSLPFSLGHSHSHSVPAEWNAAYIASASIGIKEASYQATKKVADQQNSPVLSANAWHHRVDCLVSGVAFVSIALGQVIQAAWVDPLGGLSVSGMIIRAGWRPAIDAVSESSGNVKPALNSPKSEEFADTVATTSGRLAPNYSVKSCSSEPYGSTYVGTVQLGSVDGNVEYVAEQLRESLMKIEHMRQVNITV